MNLLEQNHILEKIFEIYSICDVKGFPIDCLEIIQKLDITLYRYSDLSESKMKKCFAVSDDAFKLQGEIYYNDHFPHKERQRFTLMHELGHIVLNHTEGCPLCEEEADYFASSILAPKAAIFRYHCKTYGEIHDLFGISYAAARKALDDYGSFRISVSEIDQKIWAHFFRPGSTPPTKQNKKGGGKTAGHPQQWSQWYDDMSSYAPHMLTPAILFYK